jgi:hypothetical protein
MERVGQDDRSIQSDRPRPTIHVDSSDGLVTIAGVRKPGNLTQLDQHHLIHPQISSPGSTICAVRSVSC